MEVWAPSVNGSQDFVRQFPRGCRGILLKVLLLPSLVSQIADVATPRNMLFCDFLPWIPLQLFVGNVEILIQKDDMKRALSPAEVELKT